MCMYSAEDGLANDFHLVHIGQFTLRKAGLAIMEATGVVPEGRITPNCLGLWKDEHIEPLKRIVDFAHSQGSKMGIQIGHAGRKGSTAQPWLQQGRGDKLVVPKEQGGWDVVGPSPIAWAEGFPVPREMTKKDIQNVIQAFVKAAQRADKAGFDVVELHCAHGYLASSFLSPVTNRRTDEYGGSFENRTRFVRELVQAVRQVWPSNKPLFIRLSATEWLETQKEKYPESWTLEDTIELCRSLAPYIDVFDISTGGNHPDQKIPVKLGFQSDLAYKIKQTLPEVRVTGLGLVYDPYFAESLVKEQGIDLVLVGREFLRNASWVMKAAQDLGADFAWPDQYHRAKRTLRL